MKALFGFVSLLVALAILGLIVKQQMHAVGKVPAGSTDSAAMAPALSGSGNVREQSQQLQQKVVSDVQKAFEQGAQNTVRKEETEK